MNNGLNGSNPALESLLAQKPQAAFTVPPELNAHQLSKERRRAGNLTLDAEKKVARLEDRLKQIEAALSNPTPADNVVALSQEHGGVQNALAEAISDWERAAAYAEALG